ncbi:unnamed protein product [Allacma fusca]|uniref:Uncharacterized protein n=1 Tax=Allacma fusca TaxID=39272 RepID=A0A8J2KAI9_9HEXA|nr:unnamed protein product [Allacma fusca]
MESTTQGRHKDIITENVSTSFGGKIVVMLCVGIITFFVIFAFLKTWSIRAGKPDLFNCALLDWIYKGLTTLFGLPWKFIKRCSRSVRPRSNHAQEWRLSKMELVTAEMNGYYSL